MLLEDGFQVCSVDGSDKMLKYALKERWERRKEGNGIFDRWNIEEANWLTLEEDIEKKGMIPNRGFDAVICMGNSFAHLPDSHGDGSNHLTAISNFEKVLRPGGILVIDHRNYDAILDTGRAPAKNIYYKGDNIVNISTITEFKNAKPSKVVLDYTLDVSELALKKGKAPVGYNKNESSPLLCKFQLTYHPHRLVEFRKLLSSVFGSGASHEVLGDFESLEATTCPAYYVHIVQKQNSNGFIM
jgi:glycine N-methyltransferase